MIVLRHFARPYRGKCDCCKRVTAVQDKAEITSDGVLIGEVAVCMQCLPAFADGIGAEVTPQPQAYTPPTPQMPQGPPTYYEEVEEVEPLIEEISEDEYDDIIASAEKVDGLFG